MNLNGHVHYCSEENRHTSTIGYIGQNWCIHYTARCYNTDLPVHVISGVLKVGQNGHRHVELGELILGDGTEAAIFDSTEIHREISQ